jgi:cellulase/cellobiase CelA1
MLEASYGCKFGREIYLKKKKKSLQDRTIAYVTSDTIANIAKFNDAVSDLPCNNILGLVIYDLPGRDCAAKASNGELPVGSLSRYKTEYIDGM